jgi:hypothetical protein
MAKGLLDGIAPPRPLFLPIAFSTGAKVENVTLGTFLHNPTKIVSSLRQMRSHLRSDGVACYFDPFLEVEALGATLEWVSYDQPPVIRWPHPARPGGLPEDLRSPEEATKCGRVSVAVEVIRRMKAVPNRDFLLMAGVTGPLTLAARILQLTNNDEPQSLTLADTAREVAATVTTQMASAFVEAGADVVILQEEMVPILTADTCEVWAELLAPAINVVRFYEALPVLQVAAVKSVHENCELISQRRWDCVVCSPMEAISSQRRNEILRPTAVTHGISLPLEVFRPGGLGTEGFRQSLNPMIMELRPAMITTAGDLPAMTDMNRLIAILGEVPRGL